MSFIKATRGRTGGRLLGTTMVGAATLALALLAPRQTHAEPASCLSTNPSDWPAPAKPYFMIIVDTSGSMGSGVGTNNSCGYPNDRIGHARCAVKNTVQAFSGEANFGIASYAWKERSCNGSTCYSGCRRNSVPGDQYNCGAPGGDPAISGGNNLHLGAYIEVPMLQDHFWSLPPAPTNVPSILSWVDDDCTSNIELGADGNTPLGGALYNMYQYFSGTYQDPFTGTTLASPIGPNGQDRTCRPLNVILITDGDETCDGTDPTPIAGGCRSGYAHYLITNLGGGNYAYERLASYEADKMNTLGVTVNGMNFKVKTHVIGFVGASTTALDHIAACGGTGSSYSTANEAQLSAALANIIGGAIKPEICDNTDNNCNGCTDEGYKHYCNENRTPSTNPTQIGQCCSAARATCLANYNNSINAGNPQGDRWWLPCWTPVAADIPQQKWLCVDPGEICDEKDNNCDKTIDPASLNTNTVDEGQTKCGSPLHCPQTETCNKEDDNCDGIIDNATGSGVPYSACPNNCVPKAEVCDGCDDDCDGIADNGIAPVACGFSPPAWCAGTRTCQPQAVSQPGGCVSGGGTYSACTNSPKTEVCNGIDDDCNGLIDDGIAPTSCEDPNQSGLYYSTPGATKFFAQSQCKLGTKPCNGACTGWVGPSTEVCDGIDNDCDGIVDNNVPGVGLVCGSSQGQCKKGVTACVGGVLVCNTTSGPSPEVCDGVDNDCNGAVDDGVLQDAPANPGCWNTGSSCSSPCTFKNLSWCPPTGATCKGVGSLSSPCQVGTLVCDGTNGWKCQGGTTPQPEVCDGVDNNCDGTTDNGLGSPVGDPCGSTCPVPGIGCPCTQGTEQCVGGVLTCQGGNNGSQEVCNGKDDDCDGVVDNGINVGGNCTVPYDHTLYPGPERTGGACKPGHLECDPSSPTGTKCVGGVGPSPEVCDGVDNDCDGQVDESGPAPDGIDGTANPNDATQHVGDSCGTDVGECKKGTLACNNGKFVCAGGVGPQPEQCDCLDNNCNGQVDEDNPAPDGGAAALCSTGKTCVSFNGICQCAPPCGNGEFPCPTGTSCQTVPKSGTTDKKEYCVSDNCGDCSQKTAKDPKTGALVCGPAGSTDASGNALPLCVCKGNACKSPCDGIVCPSGQACVTSGPAAGTCEPDNNCYFQGCPKGKICNDKACVDDPCDPNPCKADEVCKPSTDFSTARCVASCAGVSCKTGEVCKEGQCVATGCSTDCPQGQYCQGASDAGTGTCGPSKCQSDGGLACSDGAYCDPATGSCGNNPCEGVVCPSGQLCVDGDCFTAQVDAGLDGATDSGGSGGTTGNDSGVDASGGSGNTSGKPGGKKPQGVWGLATGGGGCACRAAGSRNRVPPAGILLFGLGIVGVLERRRRGRRRSQHGAEGAGE